MYYHRCRGYAFAFRFRHKGPVRAGLRLGSPSKRAPKSVPLIPLGAIFSDLQGPVVLHHGTGVVTSKSAIGHLILILCDQDREKKCYVCEQTHPKTRPSFVPWPTFTRDTLTPLHKHPPPRPPPFTFSPFSEAGLCRSLLMGSHPDLCFVRIMVGG